MTDEPTNGVEAWAGPMNSTCKACGKRFYGHGQKICDPCEAAGVVVGPVALATPAASPATADWSSLPKDLYVTEVRTRDGIVFDAVLCSVPMAVGPEVRYRIASPSPAPAAVEELVGDQHQAHYAAWDQQFSRTLRAVYRKDTAIGDETTVDADALIFNLEHAAKHHLPAAHQKIVLKAATALSTLAADKARIEADRDAATLAVIDRSIDLDAAEARASALEGEVERLKEALEPFAEAGDMALISGRPPGEHVDADAFIRARAALATPPAFPTKADLISAISLAENYLSEHIEKYHDYEDDTPERASLRGIAHHLAGSLIGDDGEFIRAASPSPAPAPETWRDLDDARLQRAIDAFYEPCEGTTIDGVRNAILAWERG